MTLSEKTTKLLTYSLVLKAPDKQVWTELLPKMTEEQIQILYQVLVDEVKAWKKEGISIVPDLAVEMGLLPEQNHEQKHGASVTALKDRLEGKIAPLQLDPNNNKTGVRLGFEPTSAFGQELKKEVTTLELEAPTGMGDADSVSTNNTVIEQEEIMFNQTPDSGMSRLDKNAWMVSDRVTVPKIPFGVVKPNPLNIPKIRNRVAKYGLAKLEDISSIDDLAKVESAHLRQGPAAGQASTLKQKIIALAKESDQLPISLLPIFEQSPLSQTYLKVGALLIDKNQGDVRVAFDQVMEELDSQGEDSLSQQEFEAVADLKKDLESISGL